MYTHTHTHTHTSHLPYLTILYLTATCQISLFNETEFCYIWCTATTASRANIRLSVILFSCTIKVAMHSEGGKCCVVLWCVVLTGRNWVIQKETLEVLKERDHSDFSVGTASHQHKLEAFTVYGDCTVCSCRHSKSSAWVRSMYCVWRPYCVQL